MMHQFGETSSFLIKSSFFQLFLGNKTETLLEFELMQM